MKYMNWEDLEPGDALAFSSEAIRKFKNDGWIFRSIKCIYKVEFFGKEYDQLSHYDDHIRIHFDDFINNYIFINKNGKFENITLFKIISLGVP